MLDNEVDVTNPWRGPFGVGGAVAVILVVSTLITEIVNAATSIGYLSGVDVVEYLGALASQIGIGIVRDILFGVGIVLTLRFFASIPIRDGAVHGGWRHLVSRILLAAGGGGATVFVGFVVAVVIAAFGPGQYPFGYDFQPTFDGYSIGNGILSALVTGLLAFVSGVPVVGLVLLWLRLFGRDAGSA
ncbi:MAG: hypothetical protein QOH44_422, partial [Actinomycetota bacterium]|nr:hypothetical protein [Actinomycetota bacterium]